MRPPKARVIRHLLTDPPTRPNHAGSMHYEEIAPCPALARHVKCYWTMESAASSSVRQERILPDGCSEIVFNLADPFNQHKSDGSIERQPLNLLVGQMRSHLLIEPTGRIGLFGIRFWPGGAYPFLLIPQDEIADRVVDLDSAFGRTARQIESLLDGALTAGERVWRVESVLSACLNRFRGDHEAVLAAVAMILRSGGGVSIQSLTDTLALNSRKLDRLFNTRVGLSPKTLCRIIRFQRIFRALECNNGSRPNWVRIALDCGYYDQAHFIREFKAFTGKEPTAYFAGLNVMSDHFTQNA